MVGGLAPRGPENIFIRTEFRIQVQTCSLRYIPPVLAERILHFVIVFHEQGRIIIRDAERNSRPALIPPKRNTPFINFTYHKLNQCKANQSGIPFPFWRGTVGKTASFPLCRIWKTVSSANFHDKKLYQGKSLSFPRIQHFIPPFSLTKPVISVPAAVSRLCFLSFPENRI